MDKLILSLESGHDNLELEKRIGDIQALVQSKDDVKLANIVTPTEVMISTEGFTEALMGRVSSLSSTVWGNFMSGLDNSRAQAENKLNRVNYVRKLAKDIQYDGGRETIPVAELFDVLEIRGKVCTGSELIKALTHFSNILNNELHDEMDYLLAVTERMSGDIKALLDAVGSSPNVPEMSRRLGNIGDLGDLLIRRRNKLPYLTHDITSDSTYAYVSSELLGNVRLSSTGGSYNNANIKSLGLMQFRAIGSIFEMRTSLVSVKSDYTPQATVPQLSERELLEAISIMDKMLSDIIRFRIRYGNRFNREKRKFTDYRDKLLALGRKGDNVDHKVYLRRTADVANSISRWIHTPAMPLIGHSLKIVTATLSYVSSSLAIHRKSLNVK